MGCIVHVEHPLFMVTGFSKPLKRPIDERFEDIRCDASFCNNCVWMATCCDCRQCWEWSTLKHFICVYALSHLGEWPQFCLQMVQCVSSMKTTTLCSTWMCWYISAATWILSALTSVCWLLSEQRVTILNVIAENPCFLILPWNKWQQIEDNDTYGWTPVSSWFMFLSPSSSFSSSTYW